MDDMFKLKNLKLIKALKHLDFLNMMERKEEDITDTWTLYKVRYGWNYATAITIIRNTNDHPDSLLPAHDNDDTPNYNAITSCDKVEKWVV